jgi:hypothetical protein
MMAAQRESEDRRNHLQIERKNEEMIGERKKEKMMNEERERVKTY